MPTLSREWASCIEDVSAQLHERKLLRQQRPTLCCLSSTEALIPEEDLQAWIQGHPPPSINTLTGSSFNTGRSYSSSIVNTWQESGQRGLCYGSSPCSSHTVNGSQPHHSTLLPGSGTLRRLKLFSLNDYLGLASHPDVVKAASSSAQQYGMGYRSSAIVGGTTSVHRDLELELARLKETDDCLLFPTGFAANMAVVSSLAGLGTGPVAILSDELNHASIIDGARLAVRSATGNVKLHVYRHNNMGHLEELLRSLPSGTRAMVVTDSLFSMDGDFADLKGLARLRRQYGFLLVVDEAHGTLVAGERGAGAVEAFGVADQVDIHVGTLSKAFGGLGGFVSTSRSLKEMLVNKGRSYIYSTALPVPVVAAASAALAVSTRESWRRSHLWSLVRHLGDSLGVPALSPVVPLVVGSEAEALRLGALMLSKGFHVPAIRPPTVPPGTCRLRVSLSAAHTRQDIDDLVAAVKASGAQLQALPHLVDQQRLHQQQGVTLPFGWASDHVSGHHRSRL